MFSKETYISRREELKKHFQSGILLFLGNDECGINYEDNTYFYRQDSSFLYYFGINKPNLVALIDIDENKEYIFGDEATIDSIVWTGTQPSVKELAEQAGVGNTDCLSRLMTKIGKTDKEKIRYLPPYRAEHFIKLSHLLGYSNEQIVAKASTELIVAVANQRNIKSEEEIEEIEKAVTVTAEMHKTAMNFARPGMTEAHNRAIEMAMPNVSFKNVHLRVCEIIFDGLKALGLTKGNTQDAVENGAHALFFPCGTGHLMGLDVHDMENLGEQIVGYDNVPKSTQFGLKSLRLGRNLEPGFVFTIEPGIYFIPELIDYWEKNRINTDFINFNRVNKYRDFGGIRNEEDILITATGNRILGKPLAKSIQDVEAERRLAFSR